MPEQEKVSLSVAAPGPGEVGYVPPTDVVPLPSRGLVYEPGSPLALAEVVEIRSMTARDEDILTSRALLKQGKAISALIRSCLVDKRIDPELMLAGDRNAVLIAIRITGYGPEYRVEVECPRCEERSTRDFDLSKLEVKFLGAEPLERGKNEFSFVLPASRKTVVFKLFTGADERAIADLLEQTRKKAGPEAEGPITTRLLRQIVSIGGETEPARLSQIVRNLPARDSRALRTRIDEISPDVSMKQEVACPACGESSEVDVPLGTEFFWPRAR